MTADELITCRCADILACRLQDLADLKQVEVPDGLTAPERMEQYLKQVGNPYLFRMDAMMVKVSFQGSRDLPSVLAGLMAQP